MVDKRDKIEEIYNATLEKESQVERNAYLDAACGNDEALRARVEALLKAHEEAGDFLEVPAFGADVTLEGARIEGPGTMIGRYKLLELIGEGGMGLVYLSEQQEPIRRRVALKIVKPGMDTKQVIARFEVERQALAVLDHPNIAHVYDAGATDTGRPYFVMEYVKGLPITKYCDQNKLNIEQRLRLFEEVCEAVQYAHQKGIIHRDIKPSNILVSMHGDRAVPKIIDFGIAKAITQPLTDKTFVTFQGQLLGTPEYMSPEQVDLATQDIDIRSDIYSLGVVLYELLAGALPFERECFEKGGFAQIQQVIREQEPASPSMRLTSLGEKAKTVAASRSTQVIPLVRRLHRELEWIPLKAMRKDRCRRYRSASELADDVRNYLNGLPLIAGPETAVYLVKKFVRRHAGSVATVALVAAAIILGLIVSTAMYFRSERALQKEAIARSKAEQAENTTKEHAEKLRRTLYVNSIQLADASYREGNIRRVRELLNSCPNDLRGWEWNRLNYVSDQSIMTLRGHEDFVDSVAVSPDGKRIVSCSGDETVKVWDAETGKELMTLHGHKDVVNCVAISPDGRQVASGSYDKTIKIWDIADGKEVMTLTGHDFFPHSLAFSPDGERIISGSDDDKLIKLWDTKTGAEVMTLHGDKDGGHFVAFSPDGKRIIWTDGGEINFWDTNTDKELMTIHAYEDFVSKVVVKFDGSQIASIGGWYGDIKVWDAETGNLVFTTRGHKGAVYALAFSPDGKRIASGDYDNTINIWDGKTGEEMMTLHGHEGFVGSVAFTPDGKQLVSGSSDGTIKVWDLSVDREFTGIVGHSNTVSSIAFSPDGKHIATGGGDATIKVWDVATGTDLMTIRGHRSWVEAVSFSPDGKWIVSGGSDDRTVRIWDAITGKGLMTLRGHEDRVECVAFSPDGRYVASGSSDEKVKVWNAITGDEVMTLKGHRIRVNCIAFSPDGRRIVSGGWDKTIRVWNAATGEELNILRGHESCVFQIAFSPDGKRLASVSNDGIIKIWEATSGNELMTLRGHRGSGSVAFNPDGKRIVSGGGETIQVWDTATGAELMTIRGHKDVIFCVALSPDGKTIAAGDRVGKIVLYESTPPVGGYEPRRNGETARKVVDEMYQKYGYYYKVIDKLQEDKTLDEPVRKLALQIANSRKWEDTEKLNKQSSESVSPE